MPDMTGLTGMRMVRAIVNGERDPAKLAALRDPRCRKSVAQIERELTGNWREGEYGEGNMGTGNPGCGKFATPCRRQPRHGNRFPSEGYNRLEDQRQFATRVANWESERRADSQDRCFAGQPADRQANGVAGRTEWLGSPALPGAHCDGAPGGSEGKTGFTRSKTKTKGSPAAASLRQNRWLRVCQVSGGEGDPQGASLSRSGISFSTSVKLLCWPRAGR